MATLRIKVGAAVDPSFQEVFRKIEEASKRTRKVVDTNNAQSNATAAAGYRTNARESMLAEERKAKETAKWQKFAERMVADGAKTRTRMAKKAADEEIREAKRAASEIERVNKAASKDRREAIGMRLDRKDMYSNTGRSMLRGAGMALSFGSRIAGSMLRGAGVDFDLGSNTQKNVELEKTSTNLSNMGYLPGASGAAGKRQSADDITKDIKAAANETAMSYEEASEGLSAFVGKTGELELGRNILADMGKLSRATGSSMNDMVSAAGDVSTALGDIPHKAEVINGVMASIAGQGKLGTAEIKDMAKQMAKIAAQAPQITGNVADNIKTLGVFAQMARKGGAASATQQATSVSAMINTFKTPARIAAFKANGIDVFDKKTKMLRDPRTIMMEALAKAGNDPERFKTMFGNVQGERAVAGFGNIYKQAYNSPEMEGKSNKAKAEYAAQKVNDAFDELARTTMSQQEINESFGVSLQTTEAKTKLLNNQLQDATAELMKSVTPALIDLANAALPLARGFTDLLGSLTGSKGNQTSKDNVSAGLQGGNAVSLAKVLHEKGGTVSEAQLKALEEESARLGKQGHQAEINYNEVSKNDAGTMIGAGAATLMGKRQEFFDAKNSNVKNARNEADTIQSKDRELVSIMRLIHEDLKSGKLKAIVPPAATKADESARKGSDGPP